MKKLACLFPGIGYTCDKPLLYYSWKMLAAGGWEVIPVTYSGTLFGLPDAQLSSIIRTRAMLNSFFIGISSSFYIPGGQAAVDIDVCEVVF